MKFKNRQEQRYVNETMASLLLPLKLHLDSKAVEAVNITLRILSETTVAEDGGEHDEK